MLSVKFYPSAGALRPIKGNALYKGNLVRHNVFFALRADPGGQNRLCCFTLGLVVLYSSHFLFLPIKQFYLRIPRSYEAVGKRPAQSQ